jgi:hypothetical protein
MCALRPGNGRRARRTTGHGDRRSCRYARLGRFTSSRRPGRALPTGGGPCRLRFVGVGAACRRRPDVRVLGLARRPPCQPLAPPPIGEVTGFSCISSFTSQRSGDLPAISGRASSEVPGCGHASCCSAHGSVSALAPRSPWRRIGCQPSGLACDAFVRRPVGGPPAVRSRRRGVGGSPSTSTKARKAPQAWRGGAGRNRGAAGAVARGPHGAVT